MGIHVLSWDGILWGVGVLSKASKKVKNRESEVDGG